MDPFATELYERAVQAADERDQAVGRERVFIGWDYAHVLAFAERVDALAKLAEDGMGDIPSNELYQHVTQNRPVTWRDVADLLRNVVEEMGCDEKSLRDLADCRVSGEWPGKVIL